MIQVWIKSASGASADAVVPAKSKPRQRQLAAALTGEENHSYQRPQKCKWTSGNRGPRRGSSQPEFRSLFLPHTSLCAPKSFGGSAFLPGQGIVGEGCQVSGRINSTASNGDPCPGPGNLRQAVHSRSRERRLTKINISQAFLCGDVDAIIINPILQLETDSEVLRNLPKFAQGQ